jgi:hypothetical protein
VPAVLPASRPRAPACGWYQQTVFNVLCKATSGVTLRSHRTQHPLRHTRPRVRSAARHDGEEDSHCCLQAVGHSRARASVISASVRLHKRPLDYSSSAVLLWAINGGRLLELYGKLGSRRRPTARSQCIFTVGMSMRPRSLGSSRLARDSPQRLAPGVSQSWSSPGAIGVPCRRVCPAIGPQLG